MTTTTTTTRTLREIALEIDADPAYNSARWCASPYVEAMATLNTLDDEYYYDSAESIVIYGLANLQSWRGETARRIKAELKAMLKAHQKGQ